MLPLRLFSGIIRQRLFVLPLRPETIRDSAFMTALEIEGLLPCDISLARDAVTNRNDRSWRGDLSGIEAI